MQYARFIVHGARGSHPACGPGFETYGGHTSCFSMETESDLLVFDAGSGITALNAVCGGWGAAKPISIFLTHFHLDHITGLAGFKPLYEPGYRVTFYGGPNGEDVSCKEILHRFFERPFWPVPIHEMASDLEFRDLDVSAPSMPFGGIEIRWHPIPHSEPCLAYQLLTPGGASITLATDHETASATEPGLVAFSRGTDILIQDAQYTPEEYADRRGWGHCTWEDAARIAQAAEVKRLLITHHDPDHTDSDLERILEHTRARFANTRLARPGMTFSFATAHAAPETAVST